MRKKFRCWVSRNDNNHMLCPICNSKLASCHIADFCEKKGCGWSDGLVSLTEKQAIALAKKGCIVETYNGDKIF